MSDRSVMLDTARLYVAKWTPRFAPLAAWTVTVADDLPEGDGLCGQVRTVDERRMAYIRIGESQDDLEHTVVHELLHVALWAYGTQVKGRVGRLTYEQDIDMLATVLVECDRRDASK